MEQPQAMLGPKHANSNFVILFTALWDDVELDLTLEIGFLGVKLPHLCKNGISSLLIKQEID